MKGADKIDVDDSSRIVLDLKKVRIHLLVSSPAPIYHYFLKIMNSNAWSS